MLDYIWYFIIYSFLGWCIEVIYHIISQKQFINRGFLKGAYCPIYGFGAIFIIYIFENFINNPFILYILAVIITSTLEYITAFILQKIFGLMWWDYTDENFNLHGYICLKFSLLWGIAALILTYIIHPKIMFITKMLNNKINNIFLIILLSTMLLDFIVSVIDLFTKKDKSGKGHIWKV